MPRLSLVNFSDGSHRGLWVNGPRERTPQGFWRRLLAVHAIRDRELRTRDGTTVDAAVAAAHSLSRFDDVRFQGATTILFRAGVSISTGFDGTPLDMVVSEPRSGTDDEYLFVCGGGKLEKVDLTGVVTLWGIEKPLDANWGVSPGGDDEEDDDVVVTDPQLKDICPTTTTAGWA